MTVYRLLEILNKVKNKDLPVYIGHYCSDLALAIEGCTMPFPDDLDPDVEEGACFQICAAVAPDVEDEDNKPKKKKK